MNHPRGFAPKRDAGRNAIIPGRSACRRTAPTRCRSTRKELQTIPACRTVQPCVGGARFGLCRQRSRNADGRAAGERLGRRVGQPTPDARRKAGRSRFAGGRESGGRQPNQRTHSGAVLLMDATQPIIVFNTVTGQVLQRYIPAMANGSTFSTNSTGSFTGVAYSADGRSCSSARTPTSSRSQMSTRSPGN